MAERIASELGTELGSAVGYAVRFDDRSGEDTLVRLMTDGLLLAEIQHDPLLRRYDTIIVDEATSGRSTSTSCSACCTSCCPSGRISSS